MVFNNSCREFFKFRENGSVDLPGINSNAIYANWKLENNNLVIFKSDTLSNVFEGEYSIDIEPNSIVIKSKNTTITGHAGRLIW